MEAPATSGDGSLEPQREGPNRPGRTVFCAGGKKRLGVMGGVGEGMGEGSRRRGCERKGAPGVNRRER